MNSNSFSIKNNIVNPGNVNSALSYSNGFTPTGNIAVYTGTLSGPQTGATGSPFYIVDSDGMTLTLPDNSVPIASSVELSGSGNNPTSVGLGINTNGSNLLSNITTSSTNNIGGITSTTGVISTDTENKVSVNIVGDLLVGKQISVKIFVLLSCSC